VRWGHYPCDWKTVSSFEPIDTAQCFGEESDPLPVTLRAVEFSEYVIVSMHEK